MRPAEEAAPDPGPVHIRARRHREAELAKQRKQIDALGSKADAVKAELDTVHTNARSVGQRPASLSQPPLEPLGLGREELEASKAKIAAFEVKGGITNFAGPKDALPDALRPFITATGTGSVHLQDVRVRAATGEGSVHLHDVRVGNSPRMSTGSKGGGKGGGKDGGKDGGKGGGKGGGELSCQ